MCRLWISARFCTADVVGGSFVAISFSFLSLVYTPVFRVGLLLSSPFRKCTSYRVWITFVVLSPLLSSSLYVVTSVFVVCFLPCSVAGVGRCFSMFALLTCSKCMLLLSAFDAPSDLILPSLLSEFLKCAVLMIVFEMLAIFSPCFFIFVRFLRLLLLRVQFNVFVYFALDLSFLVLILDLVRSGSIRSRFILIVFFATFVIPGVPMSMVVVCFGTLSFSLFINSAVVFRFGDLFYRRWPLDFSFPSS